LNEIRSKDEESYNKYFAEDEIGLKIIIHYGLISKTTIHRRTKLIGEDVIIVHKLLKNSVNECNYILLTNNYLKKVKQQNNYYILNWSNLKYNKENYEYLGEIKYGYLTIDSTAYFNFYLNKA